MSQTTAKLPTKTPQQVREALLARHEIALLDVREEHVHAQAHPLFAAHFNYARIELDAWTRLPRRDVPIVVMDDGDGGDGVEGLAEAAARRLIALGYTDVALLEGGLAGWRDAGGELFRDVNVPSKSFGELVEERRHTPSLAAEEVQALIDAKADVVIVDARRYDEYQTMSIPGGVSVPGAELVLRIRELAPRPETRVIVNCAGRTRSIIGTQSLVNAGIPNQVAALRNGTIGWLLAGQKLEHGQRRSFRDGHRSHPEHDPQVQAQAARDARSVADRAGVRRTDPATLAIWQAQRGRTLYLFDVRGPDEYRHAHLPGSVSAPGGQLVQETEMFAPVRGARIVLVDSDGARANMTASWLAQMDWEVYVLDGASSAHFSERGERVLPRPAPPAITTVPPATLADWLASPDAPPVLDFAPSRDYVAQHVPGAHFVLRSQLRQALAQIVAAHGGGPIRRIVLTSPDDLMARYAAAELQTLIEAAGHTQLSDTQLFILGGGTQAWVAAKLPLEHGETRLASPRIDRYRRPYEGTDAPREAMQGYLDWEFGLVEQLGRDGTHHFRVL
ncbi:rhodanese homology domain-containing protein [Uliginosibacterium sp. H1]|uniref:rhodanese homology domain-containing protein n=1 Tax=Uliginosibacterium sp. H1 TaxID=3114757 RepID=UPI002E199E3D|nr:rhodanese homology domain-containing protein [Uliginosibacterium sp. H1]